MKANLRGNKLTLDMNEEEEDILFRYGLQIMVDQQIGKGKLKVIPYDEDVKKVLPKKTKNIDFTDKEVNECIGLAVNDVLRKYIERCEKENKEKHKKL